MADSAGEYCDLVMKGGVASGIVYPNAVLELAKKFRFKNIGGTSVGAMAAAATAAAALGQRRLDLGGFIGDAASGGTAGLSLVAGQLKTRGVIFGLFQPAPAARALYGVVTAVIGKAWLRAGWWVLRLTWPAALPILLLVGGIGWLAGHGTGLLWAALPALVFAALGAALFGLWRAGSVLGSNGYGLCPGISQEPDAPPALVEWLHATLQALAGQDKDPLLFDDLWTGPLYTGEHGDRAIDLQMITTGVSHQEPRSLPFRDAVFWFLPEEFERLFPKDVVQWMMALPAEEGGWPRQIEAENKTYCRLPEDGKLPVVVAARMSLSFPLLISAVPLHEPDWRHGGASHQAATEEAEPSIVRPRSLVEATDDFAAGGARTKAPPKAFRRCWFSDGGLSSNLPIHMFDAPLPRWPTFAIDLVYPDRSDGREAAVFLPADNRQGWQRRYREIAGNSGLGQVASFLAAIVETMRNWRDLMQARAPGYRDRIVHVPLIANEGGLNLDMPQCVLNRIADKGTEAGQLLCTEFKFDNHWWIRWRNTASATERFTIAFARGAAPPPDPAYADVHASATTGSPAPPSYEFDSKAQAAEAQTRFAAMLAEGTAWSATGAASLTSGAPNPLPQLRIVPTF